MTSNDDDVHNAYSDDEEDRTAHLPESVVNDPSDLQNLGISNKTDSYDEYSNEQLVLEYYYNTNLGSVYDAAYDSVKERNCFTNPTDNSDYRHQFSPYETSSFPIDHLASSSGSRSNAGSIPGVDSSNITPDNPINSQDNWLSGYNFDDFYGE